MSKPELLKAAMEWNTLTPSALGRGKSWENTMKLRAAPTSSNPRVRSSTLFTRRTMPLAPSTFRASFTNTRLRMPTFLPAARIRPTPMEVTPRPPTWMRAATTAWPNKVKWSATSMAMRPVTHTALVEVNRASIKLTVASSRTEIGRSSSPVPRRITRAKPTTMSRPGGCRLMDSRNCFISVCAPPKPAGRPSFLL